MVKKKKRSKRRIGDRSGKYGKIIKDSFDYSSNTYNFDYYRLDSLGISKSKWLLINSFN